MKRFAKVVPDLSTVTLGKERLDDRRAISGLVQVLKSGGPSGRPPGGAPRAEEDALHPIVRWAIEGVRTALSEALAKLACRF